MTNWLGRTTEQQKAWDEAYSWWRQWTMIACIFLPAPFLFPIWGWMVDTLGPEGAGGAVVVSQIACALLIPDRVAQFMANRAAQKR